MTGIVRIAAPREQVWAMLNDPEVLRACIPGCESLDGSPEQGFSARVTTKIGPVKATFTGAVTLSNVVPPQSYTISGEGKGGPAGFAKGGADVRLDAEGDGTVLTYKVNAQVGGKIAQLGARLVDSTAKMLANQFFTCFATQVEATRSAETQPGLPSGSIDAGAPAERKATWPEPEAGLTIAPHPSAVSLRPSRASGWAVPAAAAIFLALAAYAVFS